VRLQVNHAGALALLGYMSPRGERCRLEPEGLELVSTFVSAVDVRWLFLRAPLYLGTRFLGRHCI